MKIQAHVFISETVLAYSSDLKQNIEQKNSVKGWIRNLPNGRVEAIFEREEGSVKELIAFCKQGPPGAKVTATDITRKTCIDEFKDKILKTLFSRCAQLRSKNALQYWRQQENRTTYNRWFSMFVK
jgi:acylphosphatase